MMDFLLEVGVYVLMVAAAAGGAGFVVFRLLTSSRVRRRPAFAASGRKSEHADEDGDELEEGDTPIPAAREAKPSRHKPTSEPHQPAAATAVAPADAMVTESVQPASTNGADESADSASGSEEAASGEPAVASREAQSPELLVDTAASDTSTEAGDQSGDSDAEPGTVQEIVAPPEERNEDGDDSFMAMFHGGDDDENSMEGLAGAVENVTTADLLSEALWLTTTMKTWGEDHA